VCAVSARIARRANALLLLDDGESCAQIAKFLSLDDDTIRGWLKTYEHDGWEVLAIDGWQGGVSRLTPDQEATLAGWLAKQFCRSACEVRAHIAAEFGIIYSHSGCLRLLRRLGFEYRKPKALPRVADEAKQCKFIAFYEDLMNSLPADEAVYLAMLCIRNTRQSLHSDGCARAHEPQSKPPLAGAASISTARSAWKILTRLSWSRSLWMGTAQSNCWPKSRPATPTNQTFTLFGTMRLIIAAKQSENGCRARGATFT
jgi:transposase